MLVLTRKSGEKFSIRDDIDITVLRVKGLQVRIGIDAPPDFKIMREEVTKRIGYRQETIEEYCHNQYIGLLYRIDKMATIGCVSKVQIIGSFIEYLISARLNEKKENIT